MSTPATYARLIRIGWVLLREGVISAIPSENLPPAARLAQSVAKLFERRHAQNEERSQRLSRAVERLGPSYVKIGQFLATRPDVVGAELAADLAFLQDRMGTFPPAEAHQAVEASLGRSVSDLFENFGEPIAAASMAQVHPGLVRKGDALAKVAIKVIRPASASASPGISRPCIWWRGCRSASCRICAAFAPSR